MINKVILVGNLGQDVELKYTQSGVAVATLSVATNRSWKDKDGNWQDETEWNRVQVWAQLAERCAEQIKKGDKVYVEGRLQTRKWQDQNNNDRYTTEIVANVLRSLMPKDGDGQQSRQEQQRQQPGQSGAGEEVPF